MIVTFVSKETAFFFSKPFVTGMQLNEKHHVQNHRTSLKKSRTAADYCTTVRRTDGCMLTTAELGQL